MDESALTSAIEHLTRRTNELEEKVDALLTQDHAVSRWGRSVEDRLDDLARVGRLPSWYSEPGKRSGRRWTLPDARQALGRLLGDEDLTDEKLREAAGDVLPRVHDAIASYVGRPAAARANDLRPYTAESLLEELVDRGRIHPSRLLEDHYILFRESTYHMVHPLSCDLGDCPFDEEAKRWGGVDAELGGWYRWARPTAHALHAVPDEELPFDPD